MALIERHRLTLTPLRVGVTRLGRSNTREPPASERFSRGETPDSNRGESDVQMRSELRASGRKALQIGKIR